MAREFKAIVKTPDRIRVKTKKLADTRIRDNPDVDATNLVDGAIPVYKANRDIFELTNVLDAQDVEGGEY